MQLIAIKDINHLQLCRDNNHMHKVSPQLSP